eukprot:GEMP01042523.1.p2 GENE.GEMP01042523.1~~GEMP01042523.1.p2  ORF type:complete len:171 (+),score=30.40 GEMP01042523.1:581-1093(+)
MTFAYRRCDLAQVNKVWKEIAHKLPLRRLTAPKLPTSVHIERCSNIVAIQREVFVVSQHFWATPLEINRFFFIPSSFIGNADGIGGKSTEGEWYVYPEDQEIAITWRQAVKLCCGLIEFAGRVSDEYPHFCEISDGRDVSFRGYISEESVSDLLCGVKDSVPSPIITEIE